MFTRILGVTFMSPRHPRWGEFLERLSGPEGCNFKTKGWTCFGDLRFSQIILREMGMSTDAIEISEDCFRELGGYCDCEVVFNVEESFMRLIGPQADS